MKHIVAVVVLAVFFVSGSIRLEAAESPANSVRPLAVITLDEEGPALRNHCTATSIDEARHLWLTAAHCLLSEMTDVGSVESPRYIIGDRALSVVVSSEADLAVVRTVYASAPALKLAKHAPRQKDAIQLWGHPFGFRDLVATVGIVSVVEFLDFAEIGRTQPKMLYQIVGAPGNSGSAVLDARGDIISVLQFAWGRSFEPFTGGCTYEQLRQFLAQVGLAPQ